MWAARLIFAFGAAFTALLLVAFLFGNDDDTTLGDRVSGIAFVSMFMGGYLLFCWRMVRAGVFVDDAGIAVRRFMRTERYAWSEIQGADTVRMTAAHFPRFVRCTFGSNPFSGKVMNQFSRNVMCLRLRLSGDRDRVIAEVNSWIATWLGTNPTDIAASIEEARPEA